MLADTKIASQGQLKAATHSGHRFMAAMITFGASLMRIEDAC